MVQATARQRSPANRRISAGRRVAAQETQPAKTEKSALGLGPLPGLIGYALRRAQVAVYQDFARTYAGFDIRPVQYGVLTVIEHNPGQKQTAVGAALGIKRANFVALCDELERRNLIVRRHIPNDRRCYALHLTPKGDALLKELHQVNAEHEARVAAALGDADREGFIKLLTALAGLNSGLAEDET
jgi:DNA-binding MarR family transcriptional regulator